MNPTVQTSQVSSKASILLHKFSSIATRLHSLGQWIASSWGWRRWILDWTWASKLGSMVSPLKAQRYRNLCISSGMHQTFAVDCELHLCVLEFTAFFSILFTLALPVLSMHNAAFDTIYHEDFNSSSATFRVWAIPYDGHLASCTHFRSSREHELHYGNLHRAQWKHPFPDLPWIHVDHCSAMLMQPWYVK